jgi:hypothetical protein
MIRRRRGPSCCVENVAGASTESLLHYLFHAGEFAFLWRNAVHDGRKASKAAGGRRINARSSWAQETNTHTPTWYQGRKEPAAPSPAKGVFGSSSGRRPCAHLAPFLHGASTQLLPECSLARPRALCFTLPSLEVITSPLEWSETLGHWLLQVRRKSAPSSWRENQSNRWLGKKQIPGDRGVFWGCLSYFLGPSMRFLPIAGTRSSWVTGGSWEREPKGRARKGEGKRDEAAGG